MYNDERRLFCAPCLGIMGAFGVKIYYQTDSDDERNFAASNLGEVNRFISNPDIHITKIESSGFRLGIEAHTIHKGSAYCVHHFTEVWNRANIRS